VEGEEKVRTVPENYATKAELADPLEFPFFYSLVILNEKEIDCSVQEILKIYGNNKNSSE